METNEEKPFELMYKGPGRNHYQNITDVFDEILYRLDKIDDKLKKLSENWLWHEFLAKPVKLRSYLIRKRRIKEMVLEPNSVKEGRAHVVSCPEVRAVSDK